jgi:hypothetical protein
VVIGLSALALPCVLSAATFKPAAAATAAAAVCLQAWSAWPQSLEWCRQLLLAPSGVLSLLTPLLSLVGQELLLSDIHPFWLWLLLLLLLLEVHRSCCCTGLASSSNEQMMSGVVERLLLQQ